MKPLVRVKTPKSDKNCPTRALVVPKSSSGKTRTCDKAVNSRLLYQLRLPRNVEFARPGVLRTLYFIGQDQELQEGVWPTRVRIKEVWSRKPALCFGLSLCLGLLHVP